MCKFYNVINPFRLLKFLFFKFQKLVKFLWHQIKKEGVIVIFLTLIATSASVLTLWLAYKQFLPELKKLNSKAEIKINFSAEDGIRVGPDVTEPLNITFIAKNIGNIATTQWRSIAIFCKYTQVATTTTDWIKTHDKAEVFVLESQKVLFPTTDLGIFATELDKIGEFNVVLPSHKLSRSKIPIATVSFSGPKIKTTYYLVSMSINESEKTHDFISEPIVMSGEGKFISPLEINDCFDIVYK